MRSRSSGRPRGHERAFGVGAQATAALVLLSFSSPARATLGQDMASVRADRAHFAAAMSSDTASTHTVHTLALPNGGIVREYANGAGTVFAVTWRGPGRPDLSQLLGDRFATLQADNVGGRRVRGHRPLAVSREDFTVRSGGHPGAFWGVAYLPHDAPAGFAGADLQR